MKAFFQTSNKMKSNDTYLLFEMIEVQRKKLPSSTVQIKQKGRIVGIVLIPRKQQPGSLSLERGRHPPTAYIINTS